jgi:hypothetical protein
MPTLPLYAQTLTAGEPESWHRVNSPGGYEVWHFVAGDQERDLWAVASLSWGSTFLPRYLRRYERYRRSPTRAAPPVPKEHCCASFALYQSGAQVARFDIPVNGDEFNVSREQAGVSVGANRLSLDPDGRLHLNLRGIPWRNAWYGPVVMRDRTISAKLVFEPVVSAPLREIELLNGETPIHRWAISRPVCNVKGEISIFEGAAGQPLVINLEGRGCHDHAWGIRPLAWDFDSGFSGYVLDEGRTFWFDHLLKRGSKVAVTRIIGVDAGGARDEQVQGTISSWDRQGIIGRYPREIQFGQLLTLDTPKVLMASLFDIRLTYTAHWADRSARAFCRIVNWKRLRSPWLGRAMSPI